MENANIESTYSLIEATAELELEYADNVSIGIGNYSEIGDDNVYILIINSILYLASPFLIRLAVKAPKLLQKCYLLFTLVGIPTRVARKVAHQNSLKPKNLPNRNFLSSV